MSTPEAEKPKTAEEKIKALEDVVFELIGKVEDLTKTLTTVQKTAVTKPKGLFGGKRAQSPMKDLKTGEIYPSKAALGKNLAEEAGADPKDTFAYYKVISVLKMADGKDRFVPASSEEAAKAIADQKAKLEAEVAERNKQLEAEAAAAAKAGVQPAPAAAAKAPAAQPKRK